MVPQPHGGSRTAGGGRSAQLAGGSRLHVEPSGCLRSGPAEPDPRGVSQLCVGSSQEAGPARGEEADGLAVHGPEPALQARLGRRGEGRRPLVRLLRGGLRGRRRSGGRSPGPRPDARRRAGAMPCAAGRGGLPEHGFPPDCKALRVAEEVPAEATGRGGAGVQRAPRGLHERAEFRGPRRPAPSRERGCRLAAGERHRW
mmetsp:Transcript_43563/g.130137  ORF Transcript_43563/g.130137 Transcript_43563/m.130137 type:complete len:200 (-) Transcript_43563:1474-2073(-)